MENAAYGLLLRLAFTEPIIASQNSTELVNGILHALEQCDMSDAVAKNKELFTALLPVPNTWELLFVRYKLQWNQVGVEDVDDMLSGNEEVVHLVPLMLADYPLDVELGELYVRLFEEE